MAINLPYDLEGKKFGHEYVHDKSKLKNNPTLRNNGYIRAIWQRHLFKTTINAIVVALNILPWSNYLVQVGVIIGPCYCRWEIAFNFRFESYSVKRPTVKRFSPRFETDCLKRPRIYRKAAGTCLAPIALVGIMLFIFCLPSPRTVLPHTL